MILKQQEGMCVYQYNLIIIGFHVQITTDGKNQKFSTHLAYLLDTFYRKLAYRIYLIKLFMLSDIDEIIQVQVHSNQTKSQQLFATFTLVGVHPQTQYKDKTKWK